MVSHKETVCVTGASGFIGSWLVMRLLERGYFVRATVRDPRNSKKVQHLLDLPNAKTQLTLWKADLSDEGSYDDAINGCDGVFHVATPMDFESKDPENEVIKPTVNGMLGVMKACAKAKTVRRVVFTSSAGTVNVEEHQKNVYNEEDWSDLEFIMSKKMTGWMYFVSKMLAEKAAWDYAKENEIDFISIIPTLVIGPFITTSMPPSLVTALSPITRNEPHYSIIRQGQYVHLDDLCNAHIFLYEHAAAKGRYICSSHDATILTISEFLRQKYPEYNVPSTFESVDKNLKSIDFSSKKLIEMGFNFKYSLEEMFIESIETCRQKGFLPVSLPEQSKSETKVPTTDGIEHKTGSGLTDGMMPCKETAPEVTGNKTDACMAAQQTCA
ncbi:Dihydroflavonol 4-reductase [Cardamine amara subsp. amara]|uniref:Flavanone 4-reductase n=1 Tax=Cardamine amara subsp. amara TaxID=228776 RepID=A0ABD0ZVW7_CARAN